MALLVMPRGFDSPCLRNAESLVYYSACELFFLCCVGGGEKARVGVLVVMQACVEVPDPFELLCVGSLEIGAESTVGFVSR